MSGLMPGFEVDLDELLAAVDEMARCGAALEALLDEVSRRVAGLHLTWAGRAATAQVAAQSAWETGFREMHTALAAMRAAAELAHRSYGDAAAANVQLWGQLR